MILLRISALALCALLSACGEQGRPVAQTPVNEAAQATEDSLVAAVGSDTRSAANTSRDQYRHPTEALRFWGLEPGMTILEVQPGGGYWTEILARFAHATGGKYYATAADLDNPDLPEGPRKARAEFAARFNDKPDVYGEIGLLNFGPKSAPLPADMFDFILTARSVHGWMANGIADKIFKDLYGTLKPGGILALEQHRAKPGEQDPKAPSGYVTEAHVIQLAQSAGFELVDRSDINANPADTADHPFGVWTLPPVSRTRPYTDGPEAHDPNFDRTKYDAIGESDRMTLKFRKPAATE